jgi:uncharacterized protein
MISEVDHDARSIDRKNVSFLLDGMLGSLTRKLRILGYDTQFDPTSKDSELIRNAQASKRYLVTSDIALYTAARRRGIPSILVGSKTETGRVYEILYRIGETKIDKTRPARCSVCNGELITRGTDKSGRSIFTCSSCGKDYWKGAHWRKLNTLFQDVNALLRDKSEKCLK